VLDIVTYGISGVLDVGTNVIEEASEAELLENSSCHESFDGFSSVCNSGSFAWSGIVAPLDTLPGFSGSPFHVFSSNLESWTHLLGSS